MTIEFLYPELCNLYGDRGNMDYLRRCLPADTRQTYMGDEPWFVQHEVDLIYMCSMTERSQERIIQALAPYRERLKDLMAGGTHFLLTGNAMEVFGKTIRDGEKTISQLPIRPAYATTIHKSEGLTLDKVILNPKCFAPGQLYTALSRVRQIENLILTQKIRPQDVIASPEVIDFMKQVG